MKHQFCSFHNDHQSSIKMLSKKYVKITDSFGCQRTLCIGPKKVVLLQEIDNSLAHIVECISEYIFLISKNKQTGKKNKQEYRKAKETKEGKKIPPEN